MIKTKKKKIEIGEWFWISKVFNRDEAIDLAVKNLPEGMSIWWEAGSEKVRRRLYKKLPILMHEYQLKANIGYLDNYWGFLFYKS